MSSEERRHIIVVIVFVIIIFLLQFSTCESINRRETDWRRWTDEAEELGYNRGFEDGYDEGYSVGYQDAMNTME